MQLFQLFQLPIYLIFKYFHPPQLFQPPYLLNFPTPIYSNTPSYLVLWSILVYYIVLYLIIDYRFLISTIWFLEKWLSWLEIL